MFIVSGNVFCESVRRQLLDCGGVHRTMVVTSNACDYDVKVFNAASRVRRPPNIV